MSNWPAATPRGHVYRDAEWPHGLRCAKCEVLFSDGQTYEDVLDSVLPDGTPIALVLCVSCAEDHGE